MSTKKQRQYIASRLAEAGFNEIAIAGIFGNIVNESAFNPEAVNPNGGAYGIAQWLGSRKADLQRFAQKRGKPMSDLDTQIDFLVHETKQGQSGPTGTATIETMNRQKSAAAAATFWNRNWERSEDTSGARESAAKQYVPMAKRIVQQGGTSAPQRAKVKGASGGEMTWVPKVGNNVTQEFTGSGNYKSGNHSGVDIGGGEGGQPIRWAPPMGGKVIGRGVEGGGGQNSQGTAYGNHVIIKDEKGRTWLLAHMQGEPPAIGTRLNQGDKIGRVGNTGNTRDGAHLHVEMTAPDVDYVSGGPVKRAKIVFKVGPGGQVYDKNFKPVTSGDFLESVGLSGQALARPGNEELQTLVDEAVRKEWTNLEFTRRFKQTQWYIDRAGSQREFDMLQDTDQQQKIKQQTSKVTAMAAQMGIELSPDEARKLAIKIERDGFTQEQTQWFIAKRMDYDPAEAQTGLVAAYEDQLKDTAREYGVTLGNDQIAKWVQQSVGRGVDIDSFEDQIRDIAYDQNPFLRDALDNGLTTREALGSKLSSAAEVLGVDPSQIDITQEKWRKIFDANGAELADSTWRSTIKTDPQYGYGYTQNGLNEANTIGRNLLRAMGGLSNG